MVECRNIRGVTYQDFKDSNPEREPYSHDARLSYSHPGVSFKGLYVPLVTPVIPQEYYHDLLACLCAYFDFTTV